MVAALYTPQNVIDEYQEWEAIFAVYRRDIPCGHVRIKHRVQNPLLVTKAPSEILCTTLCSETMLA